MAGPALPLAEQLKRVQRKYVFVTGKHLNIRDMVQVAIKNQTEVISGPNGGSLAIGTIDPVDALGRILKELDRGIDDVP